MQAYEVFTKISMQNGVSGILAVIAKDVLKLEGSLNHLQKSLNGLNSRTARAIGGGLGIAGGVAGLMFMGKTVEKAAELQHIQQQMIIGGVTQAKVAEATAKAYEVAARSGQKVATILESMNEIRNPLGGIDEALHHIDKLSSAMVVLKSIDKGGKTNVADSVYALVRSAEFRNAVNGPDFDKAIDMMTRAAVATGGRVNPQEFFQFSKYARGALPGLSDRFLYLYGPELAQEFKGSSAGTAMASLYKQITGGQMTTRGARLLDGLGMINRDKVEYDKHGRLLRTKPGAVVGSGEFAADPDKFAKTLYDALVKKGLDATQQKQWLAQIFGNRNAEQMITTLMFQHNRLDRGAAGIAQTMNIDDAAKELLKNDYHTAMNSFSSAWSNMLTKLGGPLVEPAVRALNSMSAAMNSITRMNPDTISKISHGLVEVFSALTLGGIGFMIGGPIGGLIGLAVGAIASFLGLNWEWFGKIFSSLGAKIEVAVGAIASFLGLNWEWFGKIFSSLGAKIEAFFAGLEKLLSNGLSKVLPGVAPGDAGDRAAAGAAAGDRLRGRPAPAPFSPNKPVLEHHSQIFLDGDVIHSNVTRRTLAAAEHSRQAPTFNSYAMYNGPSGQAWEA
jgi:hypothetical protein